MVNSLSLGGNGGQQQQHRTAAYWTLAAAAAATTATGLWWLSRESYYSYVPLHLQYRPGTFTAWIAKVLDRHAKRRRSEFPLQPAARHCQRAATPLPSPRSP